MNSTPAFAASLLVVDPLDELADRMSRLLAGQMSVAHVCLCSAACEHLAAAPGNEIVLSNFQAWQPESNARLRREFPQVPRIDLVPLRTMEQITKSLIDDGHFAVVSRSASDLELVHAVEHARGVVASRLKLGPEPVRRANDSPMESHLPTPEELLLMVAHDVRSMAAAIHGFAELPLDGGRPDAPTAESVLSRVRSVSQRLIGLVDDLARTALLSRETGGQARQAVRPSQVVEEACLDVNGAAESRRQRIERQLPPCDTPRLLDPARLQMALRNLLDNAIRHSLHGGTITVAASGDQDWLTLTVSDSGPGIPSGRMHRLFSRPRSLLSPSLNHGMGLGLWTVKRVAQWHGGDIHAESGPGAGSTFVLRVLAPMADSVPPAPTRSRKG